MTDPASQRTVKHQIDVLVTSDQAVERKGLIALLAGHEQLNVIGEAADGRETLYLAGKSQPQVLLLDQRVLHKEGPGLIWRVWREHPDIRVLIMCSSDLSLDAGARFDIGKLGFVDTDASTEELTRVIREVARSSSRAADAAD